MEKLVVIGAGMASGRLLEHIFDANPDAFDVTLFNADPRRHYHRIIPSPGHGPIRSCVRNLINKISGLADDT